MAVLVNIQLSKGLSLCYSYDFPVSTAGNINRGSHEITLNIDSYRFIKRNKDRLFSKKKVTKEDTGGGIRSIRYF